MNANNNDYVHSKKGIVAAIVTSISVLSIFSLIPLSFEIAPAAGQDGATEIGITSASLADMKATLKGNIDNGNYYTIKNGNYSSCDNRS